MAKIIQVIIIVLLYTLRHVVVPLDIDMTSILNFEPDLSQVCAPSQNRSSKSFISMMSACVNDRPRLPALLELYKEPINWNFTVEQAQSIKDAYLFQAKAETPQTINLTTVEKIELMGYPIKKHKIQTEDNYILTYYRIPHGKNEFGKEIPPGTKAPVLLQHGLFAHAGYWFTQQEENNLPYVLANQGYDVWIANSRGTEASQEHVNITSDEENFWNFSYEEMGLYDLPAAIDFILDTNGDKRLYYIGHSMGATMYFVLMSMKPEYNDKIRLMVGYAPVGYIYHIRAGGRMLAPLGYLPLVLRRHAKLLPGQTASYYNGLIHTICDPALMTSPVCNNIFFLLAGFDYPQTNLTHLYSFMKEAPNPVSLKSIQHFSQGMLWNSFRRFNEGPLANCRLYGSCRPPEYNLTAVTSPVALFYGKNDVLVHNRDIQRLIKKLPNVVLNHSVEFDHWNHMDFITAIEVSRLVYLPTQDIMTKF